MDERTLNNGLSSRIAICLAAFAMCFILALFGGVKPAYAAGEDVPTHTTGSGTLWMSTDWYGWITGDGEVILEGSRNWPSGDIEIPETIRADVFPSQGDSYRANLTITTIGPEAFANNGAITGVTLPDTLERMGVNTFKNCVSLRSVTFEGEELAYIPNGCFEGCYNLKSFTIPTSVTEIGESAFSDCVVLSDVTIKMDNPVLTVIGKEAFRGCTFLSEITIPRTVTHIMAGAFQDCSSLEYAHFQYADLSQLEFIGDEAFEGCSSLKEIELPFKYPGVGDSLKSTIGDHVFYGCTGLEKVGFRNVPAPAAHGSRNDCFSQCSNLKFIIVKADIFAHVEANGMGLPTDATVLLVDFIGPGDSTSLKIWNIFTDANYGRDTPSWSVDLVIPKSFITYPFTSIEADATSISYAGVHVVGQDGLKSVSFEEGCKITSIGDRAFMKCEWLHDVTIPSSVTTLGEEVFSNCGNLRNVTFETTKLTEIPLRTFMDCGWLDSIELPEGITQIDAQAFHNCGVLKKVYLPDSVTVIYGNAFDKCGSLQEMRMPDSDAQMTLANGNFWEAYEINKTFKFRVTCGSWFEDQVLVANGMTDRIVYDAVDITPPDPDEPNENTTVKINVSSNHPVYNQRKQAPDFDEENSTRWWHHMVYGEDFTIDWNNSTCTDAGTATAVLKGTGPKFKGTRTITFTIDPYDFTYSLMLNYLNEPMTGFRWDNLPWYPTGSFYIQAFDPDYPSAKHFLQDDDYTASYGENIDAGVDAGSITITGKGNFTGSVTFVFTIRQRDLSEAAVAVIPDQYYTGDEIKPSPKLTLQNRNGGTIPLSVKNGDYTLDYVNNIGPGPATIIIQHVEGSNLKGSTTVQFNIIPVDLGDEDLDVDPVDDQEYTGSEIKPELNVWTPSGDELVEGKSYTVTWKNNVNVGTATATLHGISPYSRGTAEVTFEIVPKSTTITVHDASKGKGEPDPVFTGTVEGLIAEGDLGEITYVRTNGDEELGTYEGVLDAKYTENPNYDVDVVKGDFFITMPAYSVSFDANVPATASTTCAGSMDDERFAYDEKKALSGNAYFLPGYDFGGWNTEADGSGAAFADGTEVESLSDDGGVVTLYAQWSAKPYAIMYQSDGEGSQTHVQTAYFDQPGTLDAYSDAAFGWDSGAKTLHGWTGVALGSFLEDGDDFVNLCGAPDADGNVSDACLTAEWVQGGQIIVTVTKDGAPQEGLADHFALVQGSATFSVPVTYENGTYVFDPKNVPGPGGLPAQLPEGEYEVQFAAQGYPSASARITYGDANAVSVVFDYCTVSLAKDAAYPDANEVEISGGVPVAGASNAVVARDGDTLSIKTTVSEGYLFDGYTVVGVAPLWEGGDASKAEQTIEVQGTADISAHVEAIEYTVTVVGGTADVATAHAGDTVTITADAPEPGKAFVWWTGTEGVGFDNASSVSTTFTMPANDVTATSVYAPIVIGTIGDKVYAGSPIEPIDEVKASLDGVDLALTAEDYEVSFSDNVDVGTATVTVTMKDPRVGSATNTFKIVPKSATITVDNATKGRGEPDPTFTGTVEGLVAEGDLGEIAYVRTNDDEALGTYKGVLDATYKANPNYDVSVTKGDFTIVMPGYSVSFDANVPANASTACSGNMGDQGFAYDEKKALSSNGYFLPGYDFDGWNTKADGTGTPYADKAEVKNLSEDGGVITLYAQWSAKPYTIEYWSDDAGSQKHVQTAYFDRPGKLDAYSDRAFGWDSGGKTLHGWTGAALGSFLEDGDDFVNLCGAPDASGNVADPVIIAEWVNNGQIVVTVTKDGAPQDGLADHFVLTQGSATFSVPVTFENGRYVFDPKNVLGPGGLPAQLPEGVYNIRFNVDGYPSASASITYGEEHAVSVVFDYCTVSLTKDAAYADANEVEITGGEPVAGESNKVVALDGDTLSIRTTVAEGYRFEGYAAVGVAPAWEGGDPTKAEQTITVQGHADIMALVEPIEYAVAVEGGTADKATARLGETVTITANKPESGKAFVQWARVDGVDFGNASSASTTFTMPAKDVTATAVFAPIVIAPIADKVYTGSPIEPIDEVKVSLQGVDLLLTDKDYEVSFSDNVDAGTATVTVTMKDPRAGSATTTFKILPADISKATVTAAKQEYDGTAHEPDPAVTWNGKTLEAGKDYEVTGYADNVYAGSATVIVTGKGNFQNTASGTFAIDKVPLTIMANDQEYVYNGQIQGEGDTAYEDPAQIAEKITVKGLQSDDAITSVVIDGQGQAVGEYALVASNATVGNATSSYDITYVPGTLRITPKKGTLTFDLAGGTLDGQTGSVTIEANVGDMIKLPGAPTKDGYTFKYWKGSEYEAGADYTVEGDHAFTAEWEKKSDSDDDGDEGSIPGTGDTIGGVVVALIVAAACALCLVVFALIRRRRDGEKAQRPSR